MMKPFPERYYQYALDSALEDLPAILFAQFKVVTFQYLENIKVKYKFTLLMKWTITYAC